MARAATARAQMGARARQHPGGEPHGVAEAQEAVSRIRQRAEQSMAIFRCGSGKEKVTSREVDQAHA
jgi:hypothetical protein